MLGASFPGDAVGSQTNHVMWTKTLQFGGVVGGNNFDIAGDTYFDGSAYNNRFNNPIIINGYLYYREPMSFNGGNNGDTVCVNLQTGQEVWRSKTMPTLSFGYTYDIQDPNQHGVYPPILIASIGGSFFLAASSVTWMAFDAYTGYFMFNVTNVPSGTTMMGPDGEYLVLVPEKLRNTCSSKLFPARVEQFTTMDRPILRFLHLASHCSTDNRRLRPKNVRLQRFTIRTQLSSWNPINQKRLP